VRGGSSGAIPESVQPKTRPGRWSRLRRTSGSRTHQSSLPPAAAMEYSRYLLCAIESQRHADVDFEFRAVVEQMSRFCRTVLVAIVLTFGPVVTLSCLVNPSESSAEVRNHLAEFLRKAEIQFDSEEQGRNIEHVLADMLSVEPIKLRKKRYPDYGGVPNKWAVTDFLPRYFVPSSPMSIDINSFYTDVSKPEARSVIRGQLEKLQADLRQY